MILKSRSSFGRFVCVLFLALDLVYWICRISVLSYGICVVNVDIRFLIFFLVPVVVRLIFMNNTCVETFAEMHVEICVLETFNLSSQWFVNHMLIGFCDLQ